MNFNEYFALKSDYKFWPGFWQNSFWNYRQSLSLRTKFWCLEILKIFGCLKGLGPNIKQKSKIAWQKSFWKLAKYHRWISMNIWRLWKLGKGTKTGGLKGWKIIAEWRLKFWYLETLKNSLDAWRAQGLKQHKKNQNFAWQKSLILKIGKTKISSMNFNEYFALKFDWKSRGRKKRDLILVLKWS